MTDRERYAMPTLSGEPDVYRTYARILELIDGLPLNKQQAICRYLDDHVAKKMRAQLPGRNAPGPMRKKVKSDVHEL